MRVTEIESAGRGALRRPAEIQAMFDRIVRRYDLMNRLMSGGRDVAWRRLAAQEAIAAGSHVLDVATGTGDLALELVRQGATEVVGVDLSGGMLRSAEAKIAARGALPIRLVQTDAMKLPFADDTFDACTVAFGLRNMPDYQAAVAEMARVIRPGGRLVILEMTPVKLPVMRTLFGWYFDRLVPIIGGIISGDRDAYRYLPRSVGAFPSTDALALMMYQAGLSPVRYRRLMLRTVALHVGIKRPAEAAG